MKRRKMLTIIGMGGVVAGAGRSREGNDSSPKGGIVRYLPSFEDLLAEESLKKGDLVATLGYYEINDGGDGQYIIIEGVDSTDGKEGVFVLKNGMSARLIGVNSVHYKLFGAKGDGVYDDGEAILQAHQYANQHQLPVHNPTGEFWIKSTRNIPVETNVNWGETVFYIDEKLSGKQPVFHIKSRHASVEVPAGSTEHSAMVQKVRPGVQVIKELNRFENHLIHLYDDQDRIAFRAGESYNSKGRAREELIYVSQGGRVLGDIAWTFKPTVAITAYPAETSFLEMEGGIFYLSGESSVEYPLGYTHNGILVTRSRTRIRRQWVGIQPGHRDDSMVPQSGFYYFTKVYDVQLEDIRLNPREKNRPGEDRDVPHGTYGIGGNRVLEFSMIRVVAEGTGIHWGIMGTNMMKNVSLDHCRINRIDVHFHLWNLTIRNTEIGQRGITVTGGGRLFIENTVCHQNYFINFRNDYGAKWDGDVHLSHCTLRPIGKGRVVVFEFSASDFEYGYPIGIAHGININQMVIDYRTVPDNDRGCWLMRNSKFSVTASDERLFFPASVRFQNIRVIGRNKGLRVARIIDPAGYAIEQTGSYDGDVLHANSDWVLDNIDLQEVGPEDQSTEQYHLIMERQESSDHERDEYSPYLNLTVRNCRHFSSYMTDVPAKIQIVDSVVNQLVLDDSKASEGRAIFDRCDFIPIGRASDNEPIYALGTTLGTTFANCVIHLPKKGDDLQVKDLSLIPFIEINKSVKYSHMNTRLSNGFIRFLNDNNIKLKKRFLEELMLRT